MWDGIKHAFAEIFGIALDEIKEIIRHVGTLIREAATEIQRSLLQEIKRKLQRHAALLLPA